MEVQLLETVDFVDVFAEMCLGSACYMDRKHPALAAFDAYHTEKNAQDDLDNAAVIQSDQNESKQQIVACDTPQLVYLHFIIENFYTVDAKEWFVY